MKRLGREVDRGHFSSNDHGSSDCRSVRDTGKRNCNPNDGECCWCACHGAGNAHSQVHSETYTNSKEYQCSIIAPRHDKHVQTAEPTPQLTEICRIMTVVWLSMPVWLRRYSASGDRIVPTIWYIYMQISSTRVRRKLVPQNYF